MADWHPIYAAVRTAFSANGSLTAIAPDTQWFADQLPDRSNTFPALRYALTLNMPHQRLASGDNITGELQVDGYHNREDAAPLRALMDQVIETLDRASLAANGFSSVDFMCIQQPTFGKEDPYYRMKTRFRVYGSTT